MKRRNKKQLKRNPNIPPSWYNTYVTLYTGHVYFDGVLTFHKDHVDRAYMVKNELLVASFSKNDIYSFGLDPEMRIIVLKDYYELQHVPPPLRD